MCVIRVLNIINTNVLIFQYISETEEGSRVARKEERLNLFSLDPDIPVRLQKNYILYLTPAWVSFCYMNRLHCLGKGNFLLFWDVRKECFVLKVLRSTRTEYGNSASVQPFDEKLGRRLMISCRSLNLTLQGCVNEADTEPITNVRCHILLTHLP